MSSANGNNITESFNSIRDDDDLCVSCGKHGCASKSNLCKVCQKGMGIKKISARRLAQLGWTAEESFGAEKNPHHYVKGTGGTPYVGDCDACGSKGSLLEDTRTLHIITCDKCGAFEEELFDAESFGAEEDVGVGSEKWRKEPKAWKMRGGFWIDNIWGEEHDTAQEAIALWDDEVGQGLMIDVPITPYQRMLDAGLTPQEVIYGNRDEEFGADVVQDVKDFDVVGTAQDVVGKTGLKIPTGIASIAVVWIAYMTGKRYGN